MSTAKLRAALERLKQGQATPEEVKLLQDALADHLITLTEDEKPISGNNITIENISGSIGVAIGRNAKVEVALTQDALKQLLQHPPDEKPKPRDLIPWIVAIFFLMVVAILIVIVLWLASTQNPVNINTLNPAQTPSPISLDAQRRLLEVTQTEISAQLTTTSQTKPTSLNAYNPELAVTTTALAKQINDIAGTQTAIAARAVISLAGKVNPDMPASSIYTRLSPSLIDNSNVEGHVVPGDEVLVIGWTKAPWTWYLIDVPHKDLHAVWISGRISLQGKVYDSIVIKNISGLPQELYIKNPLTPVP